MEEHKKKADISAEGVYRIKGSFTPPVSVKITYFDKRELRFVTTEKFSEGAELELTIMVTQSSDPIVVTGKVTWQGHESSKFLLDTTLEYTEISAKDESRLTSFLNDSAENIKADRLNMRCVMVVEVKYKYKERPDDENKCVSQDIAIEGIKLSLKEDMPINAELELAFDLPNGRGRIFTKGKVVWKHKEPNDINLVGVKFIDIENSDKRRILRYINYMLSHRMDS
ncbi:MAG: PilZ domain-containing protein [Candidatus Omnitrophica bacterium]|nr:PilZ domain-containing protein [Candidatus Omnitrophota bacterium]